MTREEAENLIHSKDPRIIYRGYGDPKEAYMLGLSRKRSYGNGDPSWFFRCTNKCCYPIEECEAYSNGA